MRRALARALASARLSRRCDPSARAVVWRAPPSSWSAPHRARCTSACEAEAVSLMASRLQAALGDPDLVARVLPYLPRPFVETGDWLVGGGSSATSASSSSSSSPSASPKKSRPTRVAVGLSGGVDSAVTAWLLKTAGFHVTCVLMRNWDESEETGGACDFEKDQRDAAAVARRLHLELKEVRLKTDTFRLQNAEVDFVSEYWHRVFAPFLKDFHNGNATPNPDLACNRHIKFGALLAHVEKTIGADVLATGHYARVERSDNTEKKTPRLLRGLDPTKDQSYFLASVDGEALRRACFPLGGLTKREVKEIAAGPAALPQQITNRRSSAGICFVGRKQNFGDFIAEYTGGDGGEDESEGDDRSEGARGDSRESKDEGQGDRSQTQKYGHFVSVDDLSVVGAHKGLARYTIGQRARVGGAQTPWFVVGKDATVDKNLAYVAPGPEHKALFATQAVVGRCFWVNGAPPDFESLDKKGLTAQTRYGGTAVACVARVLHRGQPSTITPTKFGPPNQVSDAFQNSEGDETDSTLLEVFFASPTRALTPGQALVLYENDVCLGGGVVLYPGRSEFEKETGGLTV